MSAKIKLIAEISSEDFKKPFQHGWKREVVYRSFPGCRPKSDNADVYYITPDGDRLRTKKQIGSYLTEGLNLNMFTFATQPLGDENEIVRTATLKGYRTNQCKQNVCLNDSTNIVVNNQRDSFSKYNNQSLKNLENRNSEINDIADVKILRQMLFEKEETIQDLKVCLARNEAEMTELRKKISATSIKKESMKDVIPQLFPMLTTNQIALMTKQKKKVEWTCDEISNGFALSYFSRRGYNFVVHKLEFPQPSIRTLQRWAEKMNVKPGILDDSFVVLKGLRKNLTEGESQVIVSYDEMKCKSVYQYNKTLDSIMGPSDQMQTIMVRGLFAKFKQPIYVNFDVKMTPALLNLICTKLHEVGFNVVGFVGDNGSSNVGMWTNCGVNFMNTTIKHPETGQLIYMFSDAPHLLKLLRNWFIDGGFILPDGTDLHQGKIRELLQTNTEISPIYKLSVNHLELTKTERQNVRMAAELFSHTVAASLRRNFPNDAYAEKLAAFIELVNKWFDIMNSYSLNGIGFKKPYGLDLNEQNKILDEMYSTIKNMKCFNKQKQLQNSLQIFQKGILMSITSIKGLRTEMEEKFSFTYILTHRANQDCLENFFSQVRGRNGPNDHPTPVECLNNITYIILGKNPGLSVHLHSNTIERDVEEYVSATFIKILSQDSCNVDIEFPVDPSEDYLEDPVEVDENEEYDDEFLEGYLNDETKETFTEISDDEAEDATHEHLGGLSIFKSGQCVDLSIELLEPHVNDVLDFSQDSLIDEHENSIEITDEFLNDLSSELKYDEKAARITRSTEDGLEYLAGWIDWRFEKPVYSKSRRESVPSHISDHTYAKRIGLSSSSWIDCISYGGLTKPSEQVLQWMKDLEKEFNDMHGNEFKSRTNVKKDLVERMLSNCAVVPKEVVQLFAKARIYMRCKYLNKKRVEEALMKRLVKKQGIARKRSGDNSTDLSRSKSKKMKKIIL